MTAALIGHTGFVGASLARTAHFDVLINRTNLESLRGMHLEQVVCAGLPAAKWLANRSPDQDAANVHCLEATLSAIRADSFVLISTIDVYPQTGGADEACDCSKQPNHAYGTHRLGFERFVQNTFPRAHIVRLPALFGAGLKKNVLYDLLHERQLERINPASRFQWYPLGLLPGHLRTIKACDLRLVNLFTEPIETHAIIEQFFPHLAVGGSPDPLAHYDLCTRYGTLFGRNERYVLGRAGVVAALADFIRAEQGQV